MYGLFYFVDRSVIASIIQDAYTNVGITVTCMEDLQSKDGWIEVILPAELPTGARARRERDFGK